jgi:ATP-dependent RNA helicase DHX37/DHR1
MSGVAGVEKAGKPAETAPVAVGGALKRREDGSVGIAKYVPLKKDNKGKGKAVRSISPSPLLPAHTRIADRLPVLPSLLGSCRQLPGGGWKEPSGYFPAENEDSEDSFDSSDSENDSNEMEGMSGDDDDQDGTDGSEGSGEDEESEEEDKEPVGLPGRKRKRAGGFKDWALKQIETVYKGDGADPSPSNATPSISYDDPMPFTSPGDVDQSAPSNISQLPAHHKPIKLPPPTSKIGPLGTPYVMPSRSLLQPSTVSTPASSSSTNKNRIAIERDPMIQENRLKLPVVAEEQEIVETILMNPVTVLCGETGSGKTTQVPQFLFEAGFGTPGSGASRSVFALRFASSV